MLGQPARCKGFCWSLLSRKSYWAAAVLAAARFRVSLKKLALSAMNSTVRSPVIVQEIEKTLEQIKTLGMTTIIVEQNAIAALHLADRAIILDMGQAAFDGTAQDVL